ncbi:MAG: acyl-CoA desaturase [Bacteroidetes bacterium]|nr:acyl-CoA desaturase [Bacteroidota bacterium]
MTYIPVVKKGIVVYPKKQARRWKTIIFMIAIHLLALWAILPWMWSWNNIIALGVLYWLTACIGVTLGYHRLLSHRAFVVPRWLEVIIATCGAMSCQHGPIDWVGLHRHHHLHSDENSDHHNSHLGFWWSHIGWMLRDVPAINYVKELTPDLQKVKYYRWLNHNFLALQLPIALILWMLGGWSMVLWGIPLRLVIVYHVTWLVNSATHRWGYVSHSSGDLSKNNWWVAVLTFGEGWHNNHHAFPSSARMGFRWWEIDLTWQHIRLLRAMGLVKRIRLAPTLSRPS